MKRTLISLTLVCWGAVALAQSDNGNHVSYETEAAVVDGLIVNPLVKKSIDERIGKLKAQRSKLQMMGGDKVLVAVRGPNSISRAQADWEGSLRQVTADLGHLMDSFNAGVRLGIDQEYHFTKREFKLSLAFSRQLVESAAAFLTATRALFKEEAGDAITARIRDSRDILLEVVDSLTSVKEIHDSLTPKPDAKATKGSKG